MNIRNVLQDCVFFLAVGAALFCVFSQQVLAANTTMSQSILPVRFVYLEKDGSINRIWSNVEEKDDAYAVKFFDSKQNEISQSILLVSAYQSVVSGEEKRDGKLDKFVHFNKKGSLWEEIDTVV